MAPGAGTGKYRAAQLGGAVGPGRARRLGRHVSDRRAGGQHGDQGRDLLGRSVAADHAQERLAGGLIVVSGVCYHDPFSIKTVMSGLRPGFAEADAELPVHPLPERVPQPLAGLLVGAQ